MAAVDAAKPSSPNTPIMRLSLGRRVLRRLVRLLIVFGVGVGSTLAWQSYGDVARAMIASSWPQLGWLAPQTASAEPTTPAVAVPAAAATPPELQQLALGLAAVRQSVEQLTSQLAAGQQQIGGDITKLQADQQQILLKLSATTPRPAAAPVHKPAPVAASGPPPSSPAAR